MKPINALVMVVLVAFVVAACGGSDAENDAESPTTTAQSDAQPDTPSDGSDTSDDSQTATTIGDIGDYFDTAGGTATATVGDDMYEFVLVEDHPIANCDSDFFGGFVAILANAGADIAKPTNLFSVTLPGGNFTDPPTLNLNLGASGGAEWSADETIYEHNPDLPAGIGVTSFSIDGSTASGTATFFEQESFYQFNAGNGDLVVADGTFTVTCAAE